MNAYNNSIILLENALELAKSEVASILSISKSDIPSTPTTRGELAIRRNAALGRVNSYEATLALLLVLDANEES